GDQLQRRGLVEQDHAVHGLERGEHPGAGGLARHRAALSLAEGAGRAVGIYRDQEVIAQGPGGFEILDVTGMEQVEDAVGEDQASREALAPGDRGVGRDELAGAGAHPRYWRTSTEGLSVMRFR